jgi:hypothetical protein
MNTDNHIPERVEAAGLGRLAAAWVAAIVGLSALGLVSTTPAVAQAKPNIVFILADDLGWKDVGYHGSDIKTPNIDELAQTGARLEQFYSQQICTPSRAALMTGRYPLRYGLKMAVIPSAGRYGLATDEWLLPQALKQAGYKTPIVGKWQGISIGSIGRASAASTIPMAP